MPTIHWVSKTDSGEHATQPVTGHAGRSLMEAAVDAGIRGIAADCGGMLTCATCHVIVQEPWIGRLPPASPDEISMLDFTASPRQAGSRLSCQITLSEDMDGITVELPPTQY
jgi:2Fe-2S ferredoxin